jgi:radical SAM-linked protein
MERVIRRSGLPYAVSQGFNVHLRHSFSAALPVATAGLDEYMDLEMDGYLPAEQALAALQAVALPYLPILAAGYVGKTTPSLQVSHCIARYCIELSYQDDGFCDYLLDKLNSTTQIEILKKGKPKIYLLEEYLYQCPKITVDPNNNHQATLYMTIKASQTGSLRPAVLLKALINAERNYKITAITRTALTEE